MVFFFLIPSIPAMLGNFLVPMMIGAKDLAFPQHQSVELVSLHHRRRVHADCMLTGGVDTGWTFYTPFSTAFTEYERRSTAGLGVFVAGFSSILTGLNFIVTIHRMRAPGHDLVPLAAVHLGALRDQHHHGSGHAGARDHASAGGCSSACFICGSSIRRWAAIRCCSSISSGSIRTQPSTS